ncbi:MAG: MM0924 family protein [Candidatus Verstraetearchaeota archaeon]|nr:MM0924 family protein [Candidatus Verstraetearchaeota archaeon]
MEAFIVGHLLNMEVDVYCGWSDKFSGKIVACADGVLTLETEKGVYTHIAIDKIVAIWKKKQPWASGGPHS